MVNRNKKGRKREAYRPYIECIPSLNEKLYCSEWEINSKNSLKKIQKTYIIQQVTRM